MVKCGESGYLQSIDTDTLFAVAKRRNVVIEFSQSPAIIWLQASKRPA